MFSQKWDIPHPYRVSLCDSFYSKLNEGSLMGGEGQYGSTPPFFNLKKIPQEMTHTQREEGTGPQVLRPSWLDSTHSEVGKGIGSWAQGCDGTAKPGRMFSSSPQYLIEGGTERGKTACSSPGSLFLRPLSI